MKPLATFILTVVVLAIAVWAFLQFAPHDGEPEKPDGVELKLKLQNVKGRPKLIQQSGGTYRYELRMARQKKDLAKSLRTIKPHKVAATR